MCGKEAAIQKQVQAGRMGQGKCKVPATLKPVVETPLDKVCLRPVSSLEQALVGTSSPGESFDKQCPENILL